ncbi:unnamed protein product [Arabidopsis thaliana]|uniref:Uncharacterized protein n=1 Tax=Arabidopsis thaliana TaxID=3702 RepID=A0A654EU59_ARATH|nr:unnamed protein product [Arabidopsis thaliana]
MSRMGIIQSGMRANCAIPCSIQSLGRESLDEGHRDVLVSAQKVPDKCTRSSDLGSKVTKWGASSVWEGAQEQAPSLPVRGSKWTPRFCHPRRVHSSRASRGYCPSPRRHRLHCKTGSLEPEHLRDRKLGLEHGGTSGACAGSSPRSRSSSTPTEKGGDACRRPKVRTGKWKQACGKRTPAGSKPSPDKNKGLLGSRGQTVDAPSRSIL